MKNHESLRPVSLTWTKVAFVEVAPNAGVDQILLMLSATSGDGNIMIDGQLTASFPFRYATVAALGAEAIANMIVLGMSHILFLDAQH